MLEIALWRENVFSKLDSDCRYELEYFTLKSYSIHFLYHKQGDLDIFSRSLWIVTIERDL